VLTHKTLGMEEDQGPVKGSPQWLLQRRADRAEAQRRRRNKKRREDYDAVRPGCFSGYQA